jgi:hypothetical protein
LTKESLFFMSFQSRISWGNLWFQSVTQEQFRTTFATSFQAHPATAGRVLAMDARCGLSTLGPWASPVICNEGKGSTQHHASMGRGSISVNTLRFNVTIIAIITINLRNAPRNRRLRWAYPALSGRAGVGSIPANSDVLNVPSFCRWRFEMKLSLFLRELINNSNNKKNGLREQ